MNDSEFINVSASQRGTTLIELSVVIAVLLLLVGVLFIGMTAWKTGANTAACVVNLSSIQKAARGYANMNSLGTGSGEGVGTLTTAGFWSTTPKCPGGGTYTFLTAVPAQGSAYAICSFALTGHVPAPANLANW
jgi:prepilin-type N-terminal cleavage/methylation domain-containing protein